MPQSLQYKTMIKNIVFDFGGVLVQYDFKAFFAKQLGS